VVSAGSQEWFAARIPQQWRARGLEVAFDQDEILVIVDLPGEPNTLRHFRESTRDERMALAVAAEQRFARKVSWGARAGEVVVVFTTASVPVMTRLRLPERQVLDTLIDAGVARSRSEALAWCVRLVGDNEKEWIAELRAAFEAVDAARSRGPRSRRGKDSPAAEPDRPDGEPG
jgi:Arc/MetJ-type ribon-helix-helix transcriptional regulator